MITRQKYGLTLATALLLALALGSAAKAQIPQIPQLPDAPRVVSEKDTVYLEIEGSEDITGVQDGDFVVNIFVSLNTGVLTGTTLGLTWDRHFVNPTPEGTTPKSTSDWQFDSLIYQGDFADPSRWFTIPPVDAISDSLGAVTAGGFTFSAGIVPGSDRLMAKLYLSLKPINSWNSGSRVTIDSSFVPPSSDFLLVFRDGSFFTPTFLGPIVIKNDPSFCCDTPGDFNSDGYFNIADVTGGIAHIFLDNAPAPICQDQADANGDSVFNISDVVYGITTIFTAGPPPICGESGG